MTQAVKVLCARCHVPLEGRAEPNPDDRMACPRCGEGDRYEAVLAEVGEYIQEMATQKIAEMVNKTGRPGSAVTISMDHTPSGRQWRFIAEVNL